MQPIMRTQTPSPTNATCANMIRKPANYYSTYYNNDMSNCCLLGCWQELNRIYPESEKKGANTGKERGVVTFFSKNDVYLQTSKCNFCEKYEPQKTVHLKGQK